jgi:hypothetical protein
MEIKIILALVLLAMGFIQARKFQIQAIYGLILAFISASCVILMGRTDPSPELLSFSCHLLPGVLMILASIYYILRIIKSKNVIVSSFLLILNLIALLLIIAEPFIYMNGRYSRYHNLFGI